MGRKNDMTRINAIIEMIVYTDMADIGTGDGSIAFRAMQTGKVKKVIACDLNPKPLEVSRQNAVNQGFVEEENITLEFRLANGLEALKPGEVETAVIAGMGGGTIAGILTRAENMLIVQSGARDIKQLVLQPQSDFRAVRKAVHVVGFRIADEEMVRQSNINYLIMDCRKGSDIEYTEDDYAHGRYLWARGNMFYYEYLLKEIERLENAGNDIRRAKNAIAMQNEIELEKDIALLRKCVSLYNT